MEEPVTKAYSTRYNLSSTPEHTTQRFRLWSLHKRTRTEKNKPVKSKDQTQLASCSSQMYSTDSCSIINHTVSKQHSQTILILKMSNRIPQRVQLFSQVSSQWAFLFNPQKYWPFFFQFLLTNSNQPKIATLSIPRSILSPEKVEFRREIHQRKERENWPSRFESDAAIFEAIEELTLPHPKHAAQIRSLSFVSAVEALKLGGGLALGL